MKRNREILIEINENVASDKTLQKFEAFCTGCKTLADFTTPKTVAILLRTSEREIFRLIEAEKIHFIETDQIWICLPSIRKQ